MTSDPAVQPPVQAPIIQDLADSILDTLVHRIGKDAQAARPHDWLAATILTVRNDIVERWMASTKAAHAAGAKRVYYLSLEFLIGRLLRDAVTNLQRNDEVTRALKPHGVDLAELEEIEPDAALGNGGLAGSPPASWRAWQASRCPPMATASAT